MADQGENEQRRDRRDWAIMVAEVRTTTDMPPIPCVITDISGSGVKVLFDNPVALPEQVHLTIPETGQACLCDVRWKKPDEAGLKFIG